MPTREELVEALGQLDPAEFEHVLNAAYQRREGASHANGERPAPRANPEEFAHWLAQRHMSSDSAIERVVYLPAGAPAEEIRLLEVNRFVNTPDGDAIEPLDFTPDIDGIPFKVFVADITTDQWERVQREGDRALPRGWALGGNRVFVRG